MIALLAGSRKQEIKDNLPYMIRAAKRVAGDIYQIVIAGAPSISPEYYDTFTKGDDSVKIVFGQTYQLLSHSRVAAVTSGTATLETALFDVPQVVCYKTPIPKVIAFLTKHLLKVKYISLVNLLANNPVVKELVADSFSEENIASELQQLIADGEPRQAMLKGYAGIRESLGEKKAAENAANIIWDLGMRD